MGNFSSSNSTRTREKRPSIINTKQKESEQKERERKERIKQRVNPAAPDCVAYYKGQPCSSGSNCNLRHCATALNSHHTCLSWKNTRCSSSTCPYRHTPEYRILCVNDGDCPDSTCVYKHDDVRSIASQNPDLSDVADLLTLLTCFGIQRHWQPLNINGITLERFSHMSETILLTLLPSIPAADLQRLMVAKQKYMCYSEEQKLRVTKCIMHPDLPSSSPVSIPPQSSPYTDTYLSPPRAVPRLPSDDPAPFTLPGSQSPPRSFLWGIIPVYVKSSRAKSLRSIDQNGNETPEYMTEQSPFIANESAVYNMWQHLPFMRESPPVNNNIQNSPCTVAKSLLQDINQNIVYTSPDHDFNRNSMYMAQNGVYTPRPMAQNGVYRYTRQSIMALNGVYTPPSNMTENAIYTSNAMTENAIYTSNAMTENAIYTSNAMTENGIYTSPSMTQNGIYTTPSTMTQNDMYTSPLTMTQNGIYSSDAMTENGIYIPTTMAQNGIYTSIPPSAITQNGIYTTSTMAETGVYQTESMPPTGAYTILSNSTDNNAYMGHDLTYTAQAPPPQNSPVMTRATALLNIIQNRNTNSSSITISAENTLPKTTLTSSTQILGSSAKATQTCRPSTSTGRTTDGEKQLNASNILSRSETIPKQIDCECYELHWTNLYVKNIHEEVDEERLRREFEQFGNVTSAKIIRFTNGNSKGFGFVNFSRKVDANLAMSKMNGCKLHPYPRAITVYHAWRKDRGQNRLGAKLGSGAVIQGRGQQAWPRPGTSSQCGYKARFKVPQTGARPKALPKTTTWYSKPKPKPVAPPPEINSNCSICLTEPAVAVVLPCGHICMCMACAAENKEQSNLCPMCRKEMDAYQETFRA